MKNYIGISRVWVYTLSGAIIFLTSYVTAYSQQKIRIEGKNQPLSFVFQEMEKQVGYSFLYDQKVINANTKVNISLTGSVQDVMAKLETSFGLEFEISGRNVLVRKAKPPLRILGIVRDSITKEPLVGATVYNKKGAFQTRTNAQGEFTLEIPVRFKNELLSVSYVGYEGKQVATNDRSMDISLSLKDLNMEEIVIASTYERPKLREETVGSVVSLSAEELQTGRPIESIDKMLEGMVPGLYVEPSTSLGTPVKIHIRGQGTLSSLGNNEGRSTSTQPLFVIDGVPMQEQNSGDATGNFNNETLLNPLAGINPVDIESVTVLKDAAATTIYGANAANGVILITTRSGRSGKMQLQA
ncbi:MAG: TonB-dependent receptor plug domain-containing protein, partial [Sphingobacterium sp.]|nr:TonB-dependent receptor plug domain-containing protein [Sphingobacterium sp.]